MSEAQRMVDRIRAADYDGRIVDDLYTCNECAATLRFVGAPNALATDYCPECGESGEGIMSKVLVVGDPIVLSERPAKPTVPSKASE